MILELRYKIACYCLELRLLSNENLGNQCLFMNEGG